MKNLPKEEILLEIKENRFFYYFQILVSLPIIIYLIINFEINPNVYGILIFTVLFLALIKNETQTIKVKRKNIEIIQSNILSIYKSNKIIRHNEIIDIHFIPSEFSFTMFLLNRIIRSGANSNKDSVLIINKINGEKLEIRNIGCIQTVGILNKILSENT